MTYIALAVLLLTVVSLIPVGGVILTPFLFGLFLLALAGVLTRHSSQTVRRRDPGMDGKEWRSRAGGKPG